MKRLAREKRVSAESIARKAERGEDVSRYFTGQGKLMAPVQRVNVDFTREMLDELDRAADALHVSRQAVIKNLLRHALDHHYLARQARKAG